MRRDLYSSLLKLLSLSLFVGVSTLLSAQITTLPWIQDFESYPTCGTGCGAACALPVGTPNDFSNVTGDNLDWTTDIGGTGSTNTGPSVDHTLGTSAGHYLYTEASCSGTGFPNMTAHLVSPTFDFTSYATPTLEFWYNMYGSTMGTMHIDVSTDGGATWTLDIIPAWTDNIDLWQQQSVSLAAYGGMNNVVFRVRGITGSNYFSDMAVDDFSVFVVTPWDLSTTLESPVAVGGGSCTSVASDVTITINNNGANGIGAFNVGYTVIPPTGPALSYIESVSPMYLPGFTGTGTYTFATPINYTTAGSYTILAYTLFTDSIPTNDTSSVTVTYTPGATIPVPYFEDFEGGPAGWTSGAIAGTNDWQLGTPAGGTINTAAPGGTQSWMTSLASSYTINSYSFVESPCFDLSNACDPVVSMDVWWNSEFSWDGARLESSVDGGATWNQVGNFGDPGNWYTDNTIDGFAGFGAGTEGWTGRASTANGSGGWVTATHDLTGLAGVGAVKLRVIWATDGSVVDDGFAWDNFAISGAGSDVSVAALTSPGSASCALGMETICIDIANLGCTAEGSFMVGYDITGPISSSATETYTGPVASTTTSNFCFSTMADMSAPGTYTVTLYTMLAGDDDSSNDTLTVTVDNNAIVSFPYTEDFEGGPAGWTSGGAGNEWELGTPSGAVINTAAPGGTQSWVTDLDNTTSINSANWVMSPCMDLSTNCDPQISMDIWWDSESGFDGTQLQGSTDGGATWFTIGAYLDPVNWYNDNSVDGLDLAGYGFDGWSGSPGSGWVTASHALDGMAGQPNARIRVFFGSDGSVVDDGFGFDNINITDGGGGSTIVDVSVEDITSPAEPFCGIGMESICIDVTNTGVCATLTNIPVNYQVNGGAVVSGTIPGPINTGETINWCFPGMFDFSATDSVYQIMVWSEYAGDTDISNDTASFAFYNGVSPAAPTVVGDTSCAPDSFCVYAVNPGNVIFNWYLTDTSSTPFYQGDSICSSELYAGTVTYYVSATDTSASYSGGGSGTAMSVDVGVHASTFSSTLTRGYWFTAPVDFTMTSVMVPNDVVGPQNIQVMKFAGGPPPLPWGSIPAATPFTTEFYVAGDPSTAPIPVSIPVAAGEVVGIIGARGVGTMNNSYRAAGDYPSSIAGSPITLQRLIYQGSLDAGAIPSGSAGTEAGGSIGRVEFEYVLGLSGGGAASSVCESPRVPVSAVIYNQLVAYLGPDQTLCYGDSVLLDPGNPGAGTSFAWSTGATTQSIWGYANQSYGLTVTTPNGCVFSDTINLGEYNRMYAVVDSSMSPTCPEDMTGAAYISVVNGNGPFTYSWSDGSTSEDLTGVPGNTMYGLTITDATGCTFDTTITVSGPSTLYVGVDSIVQSTCGVSNGAIYVTGVGGTSPFTYAWSTGGMTDSIGGLSPGNYIVTITDANGCTVDSTFQLTEAGAPTVWIDSVVNNLCFGDMTGGIYVSDSGGLAPFTYLWSNGDITQDLVGVVAGTYDLTVTDANGCQAIIPLTAITEPTQLMVGVDAISDNLCNGDSTGSISITASGGTMPYTYAWSDGSTMEDLSGAPAGIYTVTVTDANGCTVAVTDTLNEPAVVTITLDNIVNVLCNGDLTGAVFITPSGGTPGYSYSWSNGSLSPDLFGVAAGSYTVTITDANGCQAVSGPHVVTEPPALANTIDTIAKVLCFGDATGFVDITTSGGVSPYSWAWSNGDTTDDISMLTAGTYTVTITDDNGCTLLDTAVVEEFTDIEITLDSLHNVLCFGDSIGEIFISVSGGAAGAGITPVAPLTTTFAGGNGQSGNMFDIVAINDVIIDAFDINIDLLAGTTTDVNVYWKNGTHTGFTGTPGAWTLIGTSTVTSAGAGNPTPVPMTIGVPITAGNTVAFYVTQVTGTNFDYTNGTAYGAVFAADANIQFLEGTGNAALFGGTFQPRIWNGNIHYSAAGAPVDPNAYSYVWSNGDTTADINTLTAGTYTVTVTDSLGCTATATYTVDEPTKLQVSEDMLTDILCFGDSTGAIDLTTFGGVTPYNWSWSTGDTTEDLSGLTAGTYNLNLVDSNGCTIDTMYTLTEPPIITITLDALVDVMGCFGDSTGSIDLTVSGGVTPYTYAWNKGQTTEDINMLPAGNYRVTVTDANGCTMESPTWVITEPTELVVSVDSIIHVDCFGDASGGIMMTTSGGTGAYTYSWSGGAPAVEDPMGITAGNYNVTVSDANGCQVVITGIPVLQPTAPLLVTTVSVTDASCTSGGTPDGAIDVNTTGGTAPYTFSWTGGYTTQDIGGLTPGTYTLTVTDANGCTFTTAPITINGTFDPPSVDIGNDTTVCRSMVLDAGPQPAGNDYLWSTGATSRTINVTLTGIYWVEVSNVCGNAIDVVDVTIVQDPIASFGYFSLDNTVTFNDLSINTTSTSTYSWDFGDGNTSTLQNPIHVYASGGNYNVTLTVTNECGTATFSDQAIVIPLALGDVFDENAFMVYPNPTEDYITVELAGDYNEDLNLELYDATAQLVDLQVIEYLSGTYKHTFDVSGLAKGTYLVRLTDGKSQITKQIVVQ